MIWSKFSLSKKFWTMCMCCLTFYKTISDIDHYWPNLSYQANPLYRTTLSIPSIALVFQMVESNLAKQEVNQKCILEVSPATNVRVPRTDYVHRHIRHSSLSLSTMILYWSLCYKNFFRLRSIRFSCRPTWVYYLLATSLMVKYHWLPPTTITPNGDQVLEEHQIYPLFPTLSLDYSHCWLLPKMTPIPKTSNLGFAWSSYCFSVAQSELSRRSPTSS